MFGVGAREVIIILLIIIVVFGYKKLPEIGQALGKAIKGFKKTIEEDEDSSNKKDK
jgi:twin arginine-targeting protein translocase, TatA/E family